MRKSIFLLFTVFVLSVFMALNVYGYGTADGTIITNARDAGTAGTADVAGDSILNYANPLLVTNYATSGNITTSTVSAGYDLSVLFKLTDSQGYASANVDYNFSFTNRGNASDTVNIIVAQSNSTGTFTGTIYSILTNGAVVAGPSANPSWTTPSIAADASFGYTVRVSIPTTSVNGNWNVFSISNLNQDGAGTGDSWPGVNAIAPATPDTSNVRDTQYDWIKTTVEGPVLILQKSIVVQGGPSAATPRPYETLRYTSQYSNASAFYATNVYLVDYIPSNTRYITNSAEVSNSLHSGSAAVEYYLETETKWTNATYDTFANAPNILKIKWTLSDNVNGNNSGTIQYKVRVE